MTQPSGASFRVDMEQAPEAIKELQSALHQLRGVRDDALALQNVDAGSRDSVSLDAARALGAVAVGGPGSLLDALDGGIDYIQRLIDSLASELQEYGETESKTKGSFDAGSR